MGRLLFGLLGRARGTNAIKELLIKPPVALLAMPPVLGLVLEIIGEYELASDHLALLPGRLVVVAL